MKEQISNDCQSAEIRKKFLPPIPSGYQIFASPYAAGIQHRKDEAIRFAKSSNQELTLERESGNKYDSNAIKLIGISGSIEYFIGYVPKDLSAQIVGTELFDSVKARLARIYLSDTDYLDIEYQIIGPKVEKKKFDDYLKNQPADLSQKDYLKFFSLPIPKGLTDEQAKNAISEHQKTSIQEEQEEWNCYSRILEEFDNKDFREGYDLKKVSRSILIEAMNQLKNEVNTYQYLYKNIDDIVEKIIELKPELEMQD